MIPKPYRSPGSSALSLPIDTRRTRALIGLLAFTLLLGTASIARCGVETTVPPDDVPAGSALGNDADRDTGSASENASSTKLIASLTIFVLAVFVGFEVITKVPPTLHTPLMSGSNAISGITLVGALVAAGTQRQGLAAVLGMIAVALATVNVVGGFLVTHRMLDMFRKK
jgi:NAD(P) transhydrogenase subunit alpha